MSVRKKKKIKKQMKRLPVLKKINFLARWGEIQAVEGVVWSWGVCRLSRAETWGAGPWGLRATAH